MTEYPEPEADMDTVTIYAPTLAHLSERAFRRATVHVEGEDQRQEQQRRAGMKR